MRSLNLTRRLVIPWVLLLAGSAAFAAGATHYRVEVIGSGALFFRQPRGVRVTSDGRLFLLEGRGNWTRVCVLGPDLASVRRFGTNGRTDEATGRWFHPASVRPTASGDLLVADTGNRRVLLFSADGQFRKVVPTGRDGTLEGPTDALELPGGDVVVCDSASSRVLLFDAAGELKRVIAKPGRSPHEVNHPFSLALDREGDLWIVDTLNRRLVERGRGFAVKNVIKPATPDGPLFRWISCLDFDRDGNLLVADDGSSCIFKLSGDGELQKRIGLSDGEPRPFSCLSGLAVGPDGTLFATDADRDCIFRFDAEGRLRDRIGVTDGSNGEADPVAFGLLAGGAFFEVYERPPGLIRCFGPDGMLRAEFGGRGTAPGKFTRPRAAALAPDGNLYVADTSNHNVTVYRDDGVLVRVFGEKGRGVSDLYYPRAVAVAPDGLVYVGDAGNRRVQVYKSSGEFVRTVSSVPVNAFYVDADAKGDCAVYDDAEECVVLFDGTGSERWRVPVRGVRDVRGIAFAPDGRLWMLDGEDGSIHVFDAEGKSSPLFVGERSGWMWGLARGPEGKMAAGVNRGVALLAEDGGVDCFVSERLPLAEGQTMAPSSLALVWGDELAVFSASAGALQVFGRDGKFRRVPVMDPPVPNASQAAAGPGGDLFLLDPFEGRVCRVSKDGRTEPVLSSDALRDAERFAFAPDGTVYVLSQSRRGIVQINTEGRETGLISAGPGERGFRRPRGMSVTPAGDVLVVDRHDGGSVLCYGADLQLKWTLDASKLEEAEGERAGVSAACADRDGNLFLLSRDESTIRKFSPDLKPLGTVRAEGAEGGFDRPGDLCLDEAGCLYVADTAGNRVVKFVPGP